MRLVAFGFFVRCLLLSPKKWMWMPLQFGWLFWLYLPQSQGQNRPVPTPAQQSWHATEMYLFFHFGPNTFTDLEWGHGTETEDQFYPTALDCDQWCRVARQAGARGVIITAKHHDGFCLWPSRYSRHTVRESKWRKGEGDVLRDLKNACERYGLKLGFYLSPWDRNHPQYGTPQYNDIYESTLTELLTQYGELFEIWWDGANGEGPNGRKQVYDFHRFERTAVRLQPRAVIFSDIGPGCRWAGNERGLILTETNWCTLDTAGFRRGEGAPPTDTLNQGNENGALWIPAECDVSIRPGWFYHAKEDDQVKTPAALFDIYMRSVGRGANLILNVPPDSRGRIHVRDSLHLRQFGELVRTAFEKNLALSATAFVRDHHPAPALNDDKTETAASDTSAVHAPRFYLEWPEQHTIRYIQLQEDITQGQRIRAFTVDIWQKGRWQKAWTSTTVGYRKIWSAPKPLETQKLRITITAGKTTPVLSEIKVF